MQIFRLQISLPMGTVASAESYLDSTRVGSAILGMFIVDEDNVKSLLLETVAGGGGVLSTLIAAISFSGLTASYFRIYPTI